MAVGDEGGAVGVRVGGGGAGAGGEEGWEREEVAAALWAGGDEGEDLGDEALLDGRVLCTFSLVGMRVVVVEGEEG